MKKIVSILIVSIFIPNIVLAAWWNPISWFNNWGFSGSEQSEVEELNKEVEELKEQLEDAKKENDIPTTTQDVQKNNDNDAELEKIDEEERKRLKEFGIVEQERLRQQEAQRVLEEIFIQQEQDRVKEEVTEKKLESIEEEKEEVTSDSCIYKNLEIFSDKDVVKSKYSLGGPTDGDFDMFNMTLTMDSNCNLFGESVSYKANRDGSLNIGLQEAVFMNEPISYSGDFDTYKAYVPQKYLPWDGVYVFYFNYRNLSNTITIEGR